MAKKTKGPQSQMEAAMYVLNQRRIQVWVPFLQDRIARLQARIEDKQLQSAGSHTKEAE